MKTYRADLRRVAEGNAVSPEVQEKKLRLVAEVARKSGMTR